MIATECAPPLGCYFDVELLVLYAFGVDFPRLVWCSPETAAERSYRARWGATDWPADAVDLVHLDADGALWLRADRASEITLADIETAAGRS